MSSFIAWFSCLGLWKIGNMWRFLFHVWQIFWNQRNHKKNKELLRTNHVKLLAASLAVALQTVSAATNPSSLDAQLVGRGEQAQLKRFWSVWEVPCKSHPKLSCYLRAHFKQISVDSVTMSLQFHGFLPSHEFFWRFAPKSYCGCLRTILRRDNLKVITFIGGFFDIG